ARAAPGARDGAAAAAPVPRERSRRIRAHYGRRRDDALPRARRAVRARRGVALARLHPWALANPRARAVGGRGEGERRARRPDRPRASRRLARPRGGLARGARALG